MKLIYHTRDIYTRPALLNAAFLHTRDSSFICLHDHSKHWVERSGICKDLYFDCSLTEHNRTNTSTAVILTFVATDLPNRHAMQHNSCLLAPFHTVQLSLPLQPQMPQQRQQAPLYYWKTQWSTSPTSRLPLPFKYSLPSKVSIKTQQLSPVGTRWQE